MKLHDRNLLDTPFLVVDTETTGLGPGSRVLEIGAAVVQGTAKPRLVLETLLDPGPHVGVGATHIHKIRRADLRGAPSFGQILPAFRSIIAKRVLAAHNAHFDMERLAEEMTRCGGHLHRPHLCSLELMRHSSMPKGRRNLTEACRRFGVRGPANAHAAGADALAAARLLQAQLLRLRELGVETFGELAERCGETRFARSLQLSPASTLPTLHWPGATPLRRREGVASRRRPAQAYLDAVFRALGRLDLAQTDSRELRAERKRLGLDGPTTRQLHAGLLAGVRQRYSEAGEPSKEEAARLARLQACLERISA